MDNRPDLKLAIYAQEKQAIQFQRLAERNQVIFAIFLMIVVTAYYVHEKFPNYDPFVFITLILLLAVSAIFATWVSHLSSLRSSQFVDHVEAEFEVPEHLRQEAWIWNYTLRSKWNVIAKFVLVLGTALLCIYLSGIFNQHNAIEHAFLQEMEAFQKLSPEEIMIKTEAVKRRYGRDHAIASMNRIAGLVVAAFLFAVVFHVGKIVGRDTARLEYNQAHAHEHGEGHHGDHHHGPIPIPDIQKEFNEKYQSIIDIQKRVSQLEEKMKRATV